MLLDQVYAAQGVASGAELKRWAADTSAPGRAQLALFFLAKSEARNSKIQRSRETFSQFLQAAPADSHWRMKPISHWPSLPGGGTLSSGIGSLAGNPGDRSQRIHARVILAANGDYREASICFQQASSDTTLRQSALVNSCISATLAGIPRSENKAWQELSSQPDGQSPVTTG